jgi:Phage late-transcription coactivator
MTEEKLDPKILTVEYLITREFTSASEFSMHIEREAIRRKIGYLETLMEYCEEKNIDTVAVASMITSSLKAKIQAEAEEMNLLKKSPKLPV